MNFFFADIAEVFGLIALIALVIFGLVGQVLIVLRARASQGRSFGKAFVATVVWLAISFTLLFLMVFWSVSNAMSRGGETLYVVGSLAVLFAYGYAGIRLSAWVGGDQAPNSMARKIALSWCAAFGISILGILVALVADVPGGPLLFIAMLISGAAFAIAIGATVPWVLSGVRNLTKDRPKRPFSE